MRFNLSWLAVVTVASCGGGGGTTPAPRVTINATPTSVGSDSSSTLTWSSTNATGCSASGSWTGDLLASGTRATGPLSAAATYTLTCTGPGGTSAPASATVEVIATATLAASPQVVGAGAAPELSWTSANATACEASGGWSGSEPASGKQRATPIVGATTYTLTCTGPGGASNPASVTVYVIPTAVLTASPTVVPSGGASVLTWSSSNATRCVASGGWSGSKPLSGSVSTGALSTLVNYTLTCTGAGGTSNPATATVASGSVTIAPHIAAITPAQAQQFTATVSGATGELAWAVDGVTGGNSAVGLIGSSGLYTPGTAAGAHTIAAASVAYPSLSANAVAATTDLPGVYTYHNDPARDGANLQEYALTPSDVNSTRFGKLFSCSVDGAIYGQPLWVADLSVNGATHNVVFVATEHDSLYAFDADTHPCVQLWSANLIDASHGGSTGEITVPAGITGYLVGRGAGDLAPEVGVTGTPVIDPASGTLYLISKSVDPAQVKFYQRLHAIDLQTGKEKPGSPAIIAATYPGSGDGGTTLTFNPGPENQRAGLAWVDGIVYVAWTAHEDVAPWYGWLLGYSDSGTALTQDAVFNTAPSSQEAGIWMGGGAPASDPDGNLYVVTGNGTFDATSGTAPNTDLGDSLLQLSGRLGLLQYFTPSDQATDSGTDLDFGAGGAAVLADLPSGNRVLHLLICGGKDGNLYLLNRDLLGGFGDAGAVQKIDFGHRIFGTGAYWNSNYFLSGESGPLMDYQLNSGVAQIGLMGSSTHVYGFGGSTPSISAAAAQNGIVWTLDNTQYCLGNAPGCGPTVLYAHDATHVATELWNSGMVPADAAGYAVKFSVPTVANGKVYVGTRGNNTGGASGSTTVNGELDVYGLRPD
jgi:hypothetical protein